RPESRWTGRPPEFWIRITSKWRKPTRAASPGRRPKFHEQAFMRKTHLTAALLVLQLGGTVSAQQIPFGACLIFGQVFGIDPLGGDMLVKRPSGDISGLPFDQATIFTRASLTTSPS